MALSEWYVDRVDGIWTLDLDPDFVGQIAIDWAGFWPAAVAGVTALTPVVETAQPQATTVSVASFDDSGCVLNVDGSGVLVTLRVAMGAGSDDFTVRFRARQR